MNWFYKLDIVSGPLPIVIWTLTLAGVVTLLIRRPKRAWWWRISAAIAGGALLGIGLVAWVNLSNAFDTILPAACWFWVPAGFAATLLGVVSFWEEGVWRKIVAGLVVILSLLSTGLGVNAAFGVDPTVGALFGVSAQDQLEELPSGQPLETVSGPLYESWTPPDDMPTSSVVAELGGDKAIPSSAGFTPRNATLYLPPAAQVATPPRLPLVVMMMGYPGNPDPSFIAEALDTMAANNKGLAPIVIVADQLGSEAQDPACADSQKFGGVSTYFNTDIPAYAAAHLNVVEDHSAWTIMGYSNGGACAFSWATHHPDVWGNIIAISPDEYPGIDAPEEMTKSIFNGDAAAFEANKPAAGIAANAGAFSGGFAVFTVGENDTGFVPGAQRNADLAEKAGYATTFHIVPGADHLATALRGGNPLRHGHPLHPPRPVSAAIAEPACPNRSERTHL